jgi:YVTN family beta-propeller protein
VLPTEHHHKTLSNVLLRLLTLTAGLAVVSLSFATACAFADERTGGASFFSPTSLIAANDGKSLFVACASADSVLRLDLQTRKVVETFKMPASPSGLAMSKDGSKLFVTCAAPESWICVVDLAKGRIVDRIRAGHTAMAPVICPDNQTLLVCNRFNNDVSVIDLKSTEETCRIAVQREPVVATLANDGKYLLVANLLPSGRCDTGTVSAVVSVVDWAARKVVKELTLPDGSVSLNDIQASPNGKYALVTHVLARYHLPANQVERGWMNANALTIIDLTQLKILNTVLLDDVEKGAANPWGIAWSEDSRTVVITHAGTHEISVIDFPALLTKLGKLPFTLGQPLLTDYGTAARVQADVPNDLHFLNDVRKRVKLTAPDRGPRAAVMIGSTVYVANYFSDTLTAVVVFPTVFAPESIPLGPKHELSVIRQGELYFNDASICYQGWQSCASCHPSDARADGLNWDLPNDGIGNPKNTKSLLLAHQTPPCMSLGVRADASTAVRAGIEHILFSQPHEAVAAAIDEYLKSLKAMPSPYLVNSRLSTAAKRGEKIFSKIGCADCHVPGLYTDLRPHDVGTRASYDGPTDKFYTPTLIEVWRTAPYLHNGSAATIRNVLTTCNQNSLHGDVSHLSSQEVDDLCTYVLSL